MLVNAALIAVFLQCPLAFATTLELQPKNADAAAVSGFSYDDLTLREVGARNTKVRELIPKDEAAQHHE